MSITAVELQRKRCKPCEGSVPALSRKNAEGMLQALSEWKLNDAATEIRKEFRFRNYYETMAFVNAVAWISHGEDHHPDLEVGWGTCLVRYTTHASKGLSENDFICAAKVDALIPR